MYCFAYYVSLSFTEASSTIQPRHRGRTIFEILIIAAPIFMKLQIFLCDVSKIPKIPSKNYSNYRFTTKRLANTVISYSPQLTRKYVIVQKIKLSVPPSHKRSFPHTKPLSPHILMKFFSNFKRLSVGALFHNNRNKQKWNNIIIKS